MLNKLYAWIEHGVGDNTLFSCSEDATIRTLYNINVNLWGMSSITVLGGFSDGSFCCHTLGITWKVHPWLRSSEAPLDSYSLIVCGRKSRYWYLRGSKLILIVVLSNGISSTLIWLLDESFHLMARLSICFRGKVHEIPESHRYHDCWILTPKTHTSRLAYGYQIEEPSQTEYVN